MPSLCIVAWIVLVAAARTQAATERWSARWRHAAARLHSAIFVLGGHDSAFRNDVWRSDDDGSTWAIVPQMGLRWPPRWGHTAVAGENGSSIVVLGGDAGGHLYADVWVASEEPVGSSWAKVEPQGPTWSPRWGHTTIVHKNGSLIVIGGYDGHYYLDDVWLSSATLVVWTRVAPAGPRWSPRWGHATIVLQGTGDLLLLGGFDGARHLNDVWRSSDVGALWTRVGNGSGPVWSPRRELSCAILPNGTIVVTGGWSAEVQTEADIWVSHTDGATWMQASPGRAASLETKFDKAGGEISGDVVVAGRAMFGGDLSVAGQAVLSEVVVLNSMASESKDIVARDRLFQRLHPDPSWNAVNGYLGLAKDAYPALNPYSAGEKAVSSWTLRTFHSSNTQNLRSVCWSPQTKVFVAVSGTGNPNQDRIATSSDGINWTLSASTYFAMRSVCWSAELGLFVVVGVNGTNCVLTSSDGIHWSVIDTSAGGFVSAPPVGSTLFWLSVCWSAERRLFVAVAYTDFAGTTTDRVMTSPNGITWTLRTSPPNNWYAVCWSAELSLFVAVSEDSALMTSPNGINWTTRASPVQNSWGSVCWSAKLGLFVAVGRLNGKVITSPDGITWTSRTSANDNAWLGVCWSSELGLFVAVAGSGAGDRIMTSPDGFTWTPRPSSSGLNSVDWSAELGIFVAVGHGVVITSTLAGRPPTSFNLFDSSFNRISETGSWALKTDSLFSATHIGLSTGTLPELRMQVKATGAVRFMPLNADPVAAEAGDVYFNSATSKLRVYNGTTWINLN